MTTIRNLSNSLNLYLIHGRKTPDESLDDWGFDGPVLKNCIGVHSTYGEIRAIFATPQDALKAKTLTGWEEGHDDNELMIKFHEDVIHTTTGYFGDWGLIDPFNRWLDEVVQYAKDQWYWDECEVTDPSNDLRTAFYDNDSPRQFVDRLAERFDLHDFHDGRRIRNIKRYEVKPHD